MRLYGQTDDEYRRQLEQALADMDERHARERQSVLAELAAIDARYEPAAKRF